MAHALRNGVSWAGLAAGPTAWALSFQANYSIVHWQCLSDWHPASLVSVLAMVAALAGAFLSWRALADGSHGITPPETAETRRFLAGVSCGIGMLFALVMAMQFAAGLIFGGCEL
jgi:hypothetical protein